MIQMQYNTDEPHKYINCEQERFKDIFVEKYIIFNFQVFGLLLVQYL